MIRLFVGLRPPSAVRHSLLAVSHGIDQARWQDEAQLHITLRFIGEVPLHQAEDIAAALAGIRASAPTVAIAGVGAFHTRGRANAVWAGIAPRAPLEALHRKIDQRLVRTGLPPEGRAYLPHVTLARLNAGCGPVEPWLAQHADLRSDSFTVDQLLLFESTLGRSGAQYDVAARYPLSPV